MRLTFLGTNGWYATGTGNTVCAVLETPERWIVLDAGDGLHRLDLPGSRPIDIFLSHFHLDHVIGLHALPKLPFRERIRIVGQPGTRRALETLVAPPYSASLGGIPILELHEGEQAWSGTADRVEALPLVHADPCWGYRFVIHDADASTKTVVYATDTGPCENLQRLARRADLLITECALAPGVLPRADWPHLNPEIAASIALESGCRRLCLTHFAANHYLDPDSRRRARAAAARVFPDVIAAEDGLIVEI